MEGTQFAVKFLKYTFNFGERWLFCGGKEYPLVLCRSIHNDEIGAESINAGNGPAFFIFGTECTSSNKTKIHVQVLSRVHFLFSSEWTGNAAFGGF